MKWHVTRKDLLAVIVALLVLLLALTLTGCTKREEQVARDTGGALSRAVGLPPFVGEGVATLVCSVITYLTGEKRGRNKERRKAPEVAKAAS